MKTLKKINVRFASGTMLVLLFCVVVFHLLVLSGAIPYAVVWGGRLLNARQMHVFETVSITINVAIMAVVGTKGGFIKLYLPKRTVSFLLWVFVILFAVNTVGNMAAQTTWETIVFTPLTLVGAALCYRMAIDEET